MKENQVMLEEFLELAIEAEKTAEELYNRLAEKFSHHPKVADFWKRYASEEVGHAKWLVQLRGRLGAEELSVPVDPVKVREARTAVEFSVEDRLKEVGNLDEAFHLVNELENSETNVVFEFLIDNFSADEETRVFLRSHLREHVDKLMNEFPVMSGGKLGRQSIKALE